MAVLFICDRKRRRGMILAPLFCAFASSIVCSTTWAAPKPSAHLVKIEAMQFVPNIVEVNVGDSVSWKNADPFPHTVASTGKGFASRDIAPGQSWKFVAKKKGSYPYICTLHPTMNGTLVVK